MKLYDAIKEIVNLKGKNIITDSSFLNYLNDYHAFEDNPAFKQIIRSIVDDGYSDKILSINTTNTKTDIAHSTLVHDVAYYYGYNQQYVEYCIESFAYALGQRDDAPKECSIITNTNNERKHFEIKHIPMVGKATSFMMQLQNNGFTATCEYGSKSKQGILVGTVGGIRDCVITVSGSDFNDYLEAVTIEFPPTKSWNSIKKLFTQLKKILSQKYGEPQQSAEELFPPYKEGDGNEDEALANYEYIYKANFSTPCGSIVLMVVNGFLDSTGAKFIKSAGSNVILMYDNISSNSDYDSDSFSLEEDI